MPSRSSSSRTASPGAGLPRRAPQLDAAWIAVLERLRADELTGLPLVVGGRSLGARVACRTADATGAVAVLCLAFPLEPPQRAGKPPKSRLPELDAVTVPTLVIQGERDRFGMPPPEQHPQVVKVRGDHGLKSDLEAIESAVRAWLASVVRRATLSASPEFGRSLRRFPLCRLVKVRAQALAVCASG